MNRLSLIDYWRINYGYQKKDIILHLLNEDKNRKTKYISEATGFNYKTVEMTLYRHRKRTGKIEVSEI